MIKEAKAKKGRGQKKYLEKLPRESKVRFWLESYLSKSETTEAETGQPDALEFQKGPWVTKLYLFYDVFSCSSI